MATKHLTQCCALSQITANNSTTKQEILSLIKDAERESKYNWYGIPPGWGEKAFFIICCPGEKKLEKTISAIGFKHIETFERRTCYPAGVNKLYFYKLRIGVQNETAA